MSQTQAAAAPNSGNAVLTQGEDFPRRHGVLRSVVFNWGALIIGAGVALALTPVMVRALGQYEYGMWVLIMSISDQYGLLDMGMTPALARFAGYLKGAQDRDGLNETFCAAFLLTFLLSLLIAALSVGLADILPTFFEITGVERETFHHLFLLLGITTAIAFPERLLAAYLRGIQRFDLVNTVATGAVVIRALLFVYALRAGYGVVVIAWITLAMGIASLAVHYGAVRWADPSLRVVLLPNRNRFKTLFGFSLYAFIASFGTRMITRLDSIVIGKVLAVELIPPFNIASRLMDYFAGVFSGVHGPVLSAMSELDGSSRREELRALFLTSSRYTLLLSFAMGVMCVANGRQFLVLWLGNSSLDLNVTFQVLVVLTVCYTANQAQLPSWSVIYARARHQLLAWLTLIEGIINLALSVYWGRHYGLIGVALGTTVPAVVHHLLIVPYYALRVIDMPATRYLRALLGPTIVGLLFSAMCVLMGGGKASIVSLCIRVVLQTLGFAMLVFVFGLQREERNLAVANISVTLATVARRRRLFTRR